MPAFVLPRKSSAHRIAAIALYRALISTCRTASVSSEQQEAIRNVVNTKFRQNAHICSKRLLKHAFEAGHEALDHLHLSAHGKAESTSHLLSVLSLVPSWMKESPKPPPVKRKQGSPLAAGFQRSALALRPLPTSALKGRRRVVPTLISANRVPVLRYQSPQPAALSRYIKSRHVYSQRLQDRKWQLTEMVQLAHWEDSWDDCIERSLPANTQLITQAEHTLTGLGSEDEPKWQSEYQFALEAVHDALDRDIQRNRMWASKMVKIVDREKELAEQERKDRQMAKNKMRRERKKMREEVDDDARHHVQRQEIDDSDNL